jgi:hypothetical protein
MQDGNLELRLIEGMLAGPEQTEDAAQEEIDKRLNHGAALSQNRTPCGSQVAIGFMHPTGSIDPEAIRALGCQAVIYDHVDPLPADNVLT